MAGVKLELMAGSWRHEQHVADCRRSRGSQETLGDKKTGTTPSTLWKQLYT